MRSQVIGYEVFYSMSDVEDLEMWQRKTVGLVTAIDLVNLERHAQVDTAIDLVNLDRHAQVGTAVDLVNLERHR